MFTVTVSFERAASSLTSSEVSQNPNCRAGSGLLAKQDHSQNRSVGKPIRRQSNIIIPLTVSPATGTTLKPRFNYSIHEVKCNFGKVKTTSVQCCDVGAPREVCRGIPMYFSSICFATLLSSFPSLPHYKYVFSGLYSGLWHGCHGDLFTTEEIATLLCCYLYSTYPPIVLPRDLFLNGFLCSPYLAF